MCSLIKKSDLRRIKPAQEQPHGGDKLQINMHAPAVGHTVFGNESDTFCQLRVPTNKAKGQCESVVIGKSRSLRLHWDMTPTLYLRIFSPTYKYTSKYSQLSYCKVQMSNMAKTLHFLHLGSLLWTIILAFIFSYSSPALSTQGW